LATETEMAPVYGTARRRCSCTIPSRAIGRQVDQTMTQASAMTTPMLRTLRTRHLPASDAILLHAMWPSDPTGRQHLAFVDGRCRTCCLRANRNSRPVRYRSFEAQPHTHAIAVYASRPLSPVVTQHSLPSGRYSLPGPGFHRLDRTSFACRLPLTRSPRRRGRAAPAERAAPVPWRS
jgi:hypothetical protein